MPSRQHQNSSAEVQAPFTPPTVREGVEALGSVWYIAWGEDKEFLEEEERTVDPSLLLPVDPKAYYLLCNYNSCILEQQEALAF